MQLSAIALSEEGALDALWQREHFPMGTTARLIDSGPMPDDMTQFTFDFDVPVRAADHSVEHPYEGVANSISMVGSTLLTIAITGYSCHHADTFEHGMKIADRAMFWRHFDRCGGSYEAVRSYEGCMTGGRR